MRLARIVVLAVCCALIVTCRDKSVTGPGDTDGHPATATTCTGTGVRHVGSSAATTWRAADNPHYVEGSLAVSDVTLEPGVLVCGLAGARLVITQGSPDAPSLRAVGTAEKPIVFTAADTAHHWDGISIGSGAYVGGSATLGHVVIALADSALRLYYGSLSVEDGQLRRTSVGGCGNFSTIHLVNVVVDTGDVCIADGLLEDVTIRRGGLVAARAQQGGKILLAGVHIENSPDIGFRVGTRAGLPPAVSATSPLRVVGSKGYPVDTDAAIFAQIWPTREAQDSLLGNFNDTLSIWGNTSAALVLRKELPWVVHANYMFMASFGVGAMTIEAGGSLTIEDYMTAGQLVARGTAAQPISIQTRCYQKCGIDLAGSANSVLSNAVLTDTHLSADDQNVITIDHIKTNERVSIAAAGSGITDSEIYDVGTTRARWGSSALTLGAFTRAKRVSVRRTIGNDPYSERTLIAVAAAQDVTLDSCEVTDNVGDGIVVSGAAVVIHQSNIERNGGYGVNASSGFAVDARNNWWGDPSGPNGPQGDGILGNIDASQPLSARRATAIKVVSVVITTVQPTVGTSDTVRMRAVARDAAGAELKSEPLVWSSADSTVALVVPGEFGLVLGARAGTTTLTVRSVNDSTVRATTQLSVVQAAPFYRWAREPIPAARAVRIWAHDRNLIYVVTDTVTQLTGQPVLRSDPGYALVRYDGSGWLSVPGVAPGRMGLITGLSDGTVYVESPTGLGYFDGSTFTTVSTLPSYVYTLAAAGPDDVYMSGDRGRVWRYHGGRLDLLREDTTLSNADVWARSPSEVYFLATNFEVSPHVSTVLQWNGATWRPLPALPISAGSLVGTPQYLYADGYRWDGNTWQLLPGGPVTTYLGPISETESDELVAFIGERGLFVYDGQRVAPVWTGERQPRIAGVFATRTELFIVTYRGYVLHGRRQP